MPDAALVRWVTPQRSDPWTSPIARHRAAAKRDRAEHGIRELDDGANQRRPCLPGGDPWVRQPLRDGPANMSRTCPTTANWMAPRTNATRSAMLERSEIAADVPIASRVLRLAAHSEQPPAMRR